MTEDRPAVHDDAILDLEPSVEEIEAKLRGA